MSLRGVSGLGFETKNKPPLGEPGTRPEQSLRNIRFADSRVVVILGLCADFYARAAHEPSLVPVLQDWQVVIGPMGVDDLRRSIKEPARLAGCEVDEQLVGSVRLTA